MQEVRNIAVMAPPEMGDKSYRLARMLCYTVAMHRLDGDDPVVDPGEASIYEGEPYPVLSTQWAYPFTHYASIEDTVSAAKCGLNFVDIPPLSSADNEVVLRLRSSDGAALFFDAGQAVSSQFKSMWKQLVQHRLPCLWFIDQLQHKGGHFFDSIAQLSQTLGAKLVPLQIPVGLGGNFKGVIDLINRQLIVWHKQGRQRSYQLPDIPKELIGKTGFWRNQLIESIAACNVDFAKKCSQAAHTITGEELAAALRQSTINMDLFPVIGGSISAGIGIQPFFDVLTAFLPAPQNRLPVMPGKNNIVLNSNPGIVAQVFGNFYNPFYLDGNFYAIRMYAGRIERGTQLINSRTGSLESLGRLTQIFSYGESPVWEARAGDICFCSGLKDIQTGDILLNA